MIKRDIKPSEIKSRHAIKKHVGLYVQKIGPKWSVWVIGAHICTKVFKTRDKAIKWARTVAKIQRTIFYVHNENGTIRRKYDYTKK